ncbi:hypothetical protein [Duganella sp. BuS-21]|uniref:hypothetical protein n=1 Tax=Duganella sp. BuS-21 TaxID=2943848 RepID=UPI0035A6D32D
MKKNVSIVIFFFLGAIQSVKASDEKSSAPSKGDSLIIKNLKNELVNSLSDPESAKFRSIGFNPKTKTLCGEVNAKNSFGGYSGFQWFSWSHGKGGGVLPMPGVPREKIIEFLNKATDENGEQNPFQCAVK